MATYSIFFGARRRLALSIIMILICAASMAAQPVRGEKSFGVKAGYVSANGSAVGGLVFGYAFSRHFRIAPQLGVVFRNHNEDALLVDIDCHFPIGLRNERFTVYPLAGMAFNSWVEHLKAIDDDGDDVTTRRNRLGANLGAGVDFYVKPSLKLTVECRHTLISKHSGVQATAGIAYVF